MAISPPRNSGRTINVPARRARVRAGECEAMRKSRLIVLPPRPPAMTRKEMVAADSLPGSARGPGVRRLRAWEEG